MRDTCSEHHVDVSNQPAQHRSVARGADGWLALAAAPTFAVMALLTHSSGNMICGATRDASSLTGMATMYGLMSAFHLAPWLRLMNSGGKSIRLPQTT